MFTGIIENIGTVIKATKKGSNKILLIESKLASFLKIDQSVSHNGVCLTVISSNKKSFGVVIINETLSRTNLGEIKTGDQINLERSITLSTRISGHLVQGHVDATCQIKNIKSLNGSWVFELSLAKKYRKWIIEKGSVCLNGISLTVSKIRKASFEVSIIPYTFENTNLNCAKSGDFINIEFDLIGKYVSNLLKK